MFEEILGRYRRSKEEKNYDKLVAMTDEEIEEAIEEAFKFMKEKEDMPPKVEKKLLEFKTMVESWSPIEAGYNFCFVQLKDHLSTTFAAFPDLLVKKIEEASKVYADLPPVYLKFAKQWKENSSQELG